jgi:hypothetical protein
MPRVGHDELAELRGQNRRRGGNLSARCAAPQDAGIIYTSAGPARCRQSKHGWPCADIVTRCTPAKINGASAARRRQDAGVTLAGPREGGHHRSGRFASRNSL